MGEKKRDFRLNLFFGIINVVLIIINISIGFHFFNKSQKQNYEIAQMSGAFDKGNLLLGTGDFFFRPNTKYNLYLGVDKLDTSYHFFSIPFEIWNSGQKSVNKAFTMFRYSDFPRISVTNDLIGISSSAFFEINREWNTLQPFDFVTYSMEKLNPDIHFRINEIILATNTQFEDTITVPNTIFEKTPFKYKIDYGLDFAVITTADNIPSKNYDFTVFIYETTNIDSLIAINARHINNDNKRLNSNSLYLTQKKTINSNAGEIAITQHDFNPDNSKFGHYSEDLGRLHVINQDKSEYKKLNIIE